jgi:hypothetical protein
MAWCGVQRDSPRVHSGKSMGVLLRNDLTLLLLCISQDSETGERDCSDSFLTTEGGSLLNNAGNSTLGEGTLLRV